MSIIRHTYTNEYVRDEDCVIHLTHCGVWIDSQDAVAVDFFEEDEIESCSKCESNTTLNEI